MFNLVVGLTSPSGLIMWGLCYAVRHHITRGLWAVTGGLFFIWVVGMALKREDQMQITFWVIIILVGVIGWFLLICWFQPIKLYRAIRHRKSRESPPANNATVTDLDEHRNSKAG